MTDTPKARSAQPREFIAGHAIEAAAQEHGADINWLHLESVMNRYGLSPYDVLEKAQELLLQYQRNPEQLERPSREYMFLLRIFSICSGTCRSVYRSLQLKEQNRDNAKIVIGLQEIERILLAHLG